MARFVATTVVGVVGLSLAFILGGCFSRGIPCDTSCSAANNVCRDGFCVLDSATHSDAGTHDAGVVDAGTQDAGIADAGTRDAGVVDAGPATTCGNPTPGFVVPDDAFVSANVDFEAPVPIADAPAQLVVVSTSSAAITATQDGVNNALHVHTDFAGSHTVDYCVLQLGAFSNVALLTVLSGADVAVWTGANNSSSSVAVNWAAGFPHFNQVWFVPRTTNAPIVNTTSTSGGLVVASGTSIHLGQILTVQGSVHAAGGVDGNGLHFLDLTGVGTLAGNITGDVFVDGTRTVDDTLTVTNGTVHLTSGSTIVFAADASMTTLSTTAGANPTVQACAGVTVHVATCKLGFDVAAPCDARPAGLLDCALTDPL